MSQSSPADMEAQFNPHEVAKRWYPRWEQAGWFAPAAEAGGEGFCIVLPPPNVTGTLHMGHGFQVTLMDALIRYHRMCGRDVLWQGGTDHAGIATQMVVERQLEAGNESRASLGRDAFVQRVWQWKEQSGDTIARQLRRLGASIDWSRERFTLDAGYSEAVLDVFVRLYEQGLIYRDRRMVNWDPQLQTALSDLEVESREVNGNLWHIRYPLVEGDGWLEIATTRPETMLGDGAVAVNPADERHRQLVGKEVYLPLTDRRLPVITDDYVDPEFGSGCVKITAAHDFNDFEVAQRHGVQPYMIMDLQGRIVDGPEADKAGIPQSLRGLDRFVARKEMVKMLQAEGLLSRTEPHKHQVPHGDRSGVVLEPMLTEQWFMDMGGLAERALTAVESGDVRFVPDQWRNTYNAWLGEIRDWCLSRQLWWGHRIPAWYDKDGEVHVARTAKEAAARAGCAPGELRQEESVLDTWFSSALWTLVPLGWPDNEAEVRRWNPTSVLVTGFDIIFFWVARMIMMSLHLTDGVPFKDVFVHGLIRDSRGQKMSKSRGNTLDPLDLIDGISLQDLVEKRTAGLMQPQMQQQVEKRTKQDFPNGIPAYGADALRFTFCSLASHDRDIHFDTGQLEGYRNFCNKLWNAARFVLRRLDEGEQFQPVTKLARREDNIPERWILHRLQQTVREVHAAMADYRLDRASEAVYQFVWHEYCDWYLECAKIALDDEGTSSERRAEILAMLPHVLEQVSRLAHPMLPFITEELWQQVAPRLGIAGETVMLASFPECDEALLDAEASADFDWLMGAVTGLRGIRSVLELHPKKQMVLGCIGDNAAEVRRLRIFSPLIPSLCGIRTILPLGGVWGEPAISHRQDGMELAVPLGGLVDDFALAKERIDRQRQHMSKLIANYSKKLDNPAYRNKAPLEIVQDTERRYEVARQHFANASHHALSLIDYRDAARAAPLYQPVLEDAKNLLGEKDPDYQLIRNTHAHSLKNAEHFKEAAELFRSFREDCQKQYGKQHPLYAHSTHNLASAVKRLPEGLEEARELYEEALSVLKETLGEQHFTYASTLDGLASVLEMQGQLDDAEERIRQALDIIQDVAGENHPDYAFALSNLALLLKRKGEQLSEAEKSCTQALKIIEETYGTKHPAYDGMQRNLANITDGKRPAVH